MLFPVFLLQALEFLDLFRTPPINLLKRGERGTFRRDRDLLEEFSEAFIGSQIISVPPTVSFSPESLLSNFLGQYRLLRTSYFHQEKLARLPEGLINVRDKIPARTVKQVTLRPTQTSTSNWAFRDLTRTGCTLAERSTPIQSFGTFRDGALTV